MESLAQRMDAGEPPRAREVLEIQRQANRWTFLARHDPPIFLARLKASPRRASAWSEASPSVERAGKYVRQRCRWFWLIRKFG